MLDSSHRSTAIVLLVRIRVAAFIVTAEHAEAANQADGNSEERNDAHGQSPIWLYLSVIVVAQRQDLVGVDVLVTEEPREAATLEVVNGHVYQGRLELEFVRARYRRVCT